MPFGSGNWWVPILIGVVVLATLVPVVVLLLKSRRRSLTTPMRGSLIVTASPYPPRGAMSANFDLTGVISGPNIPPTPVQRSGIARTAKWPSPGVTLAVEYEAENPQVFNILWNEMADGDVRAAAAAAQLAHQMTMHQPGIAAGSGYGAGPGFGVTGVAPAGYPVQMAVPNLVGSGVATVTAVSTHALAAGMVAAQISAQVVPDNGFAPFMTTVNVTFRAESALLRDQMCRFGAQFPVRFDPANIANSVPDTSRLPGAK